MTTMCPACGGPKAKPTAATCHPCYLRRVTSRRSRRCIDCRSPVSSRHRETVRCRPCWRIAHPAKPLPVAKTFDIDEVAVHRLRIGAPVEANVTERRAAAEQLTRAGLAAEEIARRLRVTKRTVQRYRQGQAV